jgi:hypothetical protein
MELLPNGHATAIEKLCDGYRTAVERLPNNHGAAMGRNVIAAGRAGFRRRPGC